MTPDAHDPEDGFTAWAVECDEALASGLTPAPPPAEDATAARRRQRFQDCLYRLDRARRRQSAAADPPRRLGRFEIVRELGGGAHGVVYLAHDPLLRRPVALKVPRLAALLDGDLRQRFLREARAAAGLSHPHIVAVYEAGEEAGVCYLASAYCPGTTLADWLRRQGQPVPPRTAAALVADLADAVAHAHARGIIHRDLKPANILLTADREGDAGRSPPRSSGPSAGSPKITDFGLAKLTAGEGEATRTGAILGTPAYMAPEQARGRVRDVGPPADVYALGVILYELLTRQLPSGAGETLEVLRRVAEEEPVPPRRLRPALHGDLEVICLKCLEKDPGRRYAGAAELAADLRRFVDGEAIRARPAPGWERAWRWARRRVRSAGVVAVAVLAAAALAAGWLWHRESASRAELERRRLEYARHLPDAQRAWEAGDGVTALQLLNALRPAPGQPDLRGFEWHYLWRQLERDGLRVASRRRGVSCLTYAPDGRSLAAGCGDGTVELWDPATGRVRLHWQAHDGAVSRLAFSPDGRTLASGGADYWVKFWDAATGRETGVPRRHDQVPVHLTFSADGRALATRDGNRQVLVSDVPSGRLVRRFDGLTACGIAFLPDGQTVAAAEGRSGIRLLDVGTGRIRAVWQPAGHDVIGVACDVPRGLLASRGNEGTTYVWDVASGRVRTTLAGTGVLGDRFYASALAFAPDGRTLAVGNSAADGSARRVVRLFGLADRPALLSSYEQAGGGFGGMSFAPDGRTLAVGGADGEIRLWRPFPGPAPAPSGHAPEEAWSLAFSPDGTRLASGGDNEKEPNNLRLWDVATGRLGWAVPAHAVLVRRVAYSPRGDLIATGAQDGAVKLWEPATGRELAELPRQTAKIFDLAFSPDGRRLVSADAAGVVNLWDVPACRELRTLPRHGFATRAVAFSPDGRRLATSTGDADPEVRMWDVATGRLEQSYTQPHTCHCLAFGPDGRTLALGGKDGRVQLWDLATGRRRLLFADNQAEVRALAFTPDGRTLASAGADRVIRLWDPVTGYQLLTLPGHKAPINAIAFSPDGTTLASAAHDGAIRLWRAAAQDE